MSFHAGQTFTFGETPSATKWNYLWENDYALQDWSAFTNDTFPIALIQDGDITAAKLDADAIGHGYLEIGRTTLGSAADTISVQNLPAFNYLALVFKLFATGGTISGGYNFNNDLGNNYTYRTSLNNGADGGSASASRAYPHSSTQNQTLFNIMQIINLAAYEKFGMGQTAENVNGAANSTNRVEATIKWANTSAQINRVDVTNAGSGSFDVGSEVIVYGRN